jgi:hypothetical protein
VRLGAVALGAALLALLPDVAAAQAYPTYPWQQLDATGVDTGLIRAMSVRVSVDGDALTATIDEAHFNGAAISLTMSARLSDLNLDVAQARESMRSIHPHVGVVVFRCRGGARCVTYSAPGDSFFEFPGPTQFGFFVQDGAMAEQALADLRRIAGGGS